MLVNSALLTTALGLTTLVAAAPSHKHRACGRGKDRCPRGTECVANYSTCSDLKKCHGRCVPNANPLSYPTPLILPLPWDLLPTDGPVIDLPDFFPAEPTGAPTTDPLIDLLIDLFPAEPSGAPTTDSLIDLLTELFPLDPVIDPIIDPITDILLEPTIDPIIDPITDILLEPSILTIPFPEPELPTPIIEPFPFPGEPTRTSEPLPSEVLTTPPAETPGNEYPSCGGFRIDPAPCPSGSYCADDPRNPFDCGMACDAPGICIPRDAAICGGFAGLECPAGLECYDYPSDDCDPREGWSDCIGICL
jgi:hypothetical protein